MSFLNLGSIRKNLALLVLLTVLPAIAILLYSGMEERKNTIEHAKQDILLITHAMAEIQKDVTLSAQQILSTLVLIPEVQDLDIQISTDIFKNLLKRNPNYKNIALVDLRGNVLASGTPFKEVNLADHKHILDALKTKDFAIGEYVLAPVGNAEPVFPFAYPILDATGTPKAVLSIAIKLTVFSELYSHAHLPPNSFVGITDHQGVRLHHYPVKATTNPVGKPIKASNWKIASQAQEPGIMTAAGADGTNRIFAFESIRLNANTDPYMYVWAGVPETFILAAANSILQRNLLLILLATMGALFISWSLARKTLITPINNLVGMTNELAKGNFGHHTEQTSRIDEFDKLTKSFHDMAESLSINQYELRKSEEKHRSLFDNAPFPYQALDAEGRFIDVNLNWLKTLGYSVDEVIGQWYGSFLAVEDQKVFADNFPTLKNSGYVHSVPFKLRHKKGHYLDILLEGRSGYMPDGSFIQTYCIFQDVSEKKRAEEEINLNELKFRLLADYTYDWESWLNPQNEYVYISPACERITGYTPIEFISNPQLFFDLVSPAYKETVQRHYTEGNNKNTPAHVMEFLINNKNGEERWIEHHCCAVFDEQGQYAGRRSNNRDITDRKKSEQDRLELGNQLRQKHKMEAVGYMAGGMAHNFNNNLAIILGNVELSQLKVQDPKVQELLKNAKTAIMRSRDLVSQIITYSRKGIQNKAPMQLLTIVDETITLLSSTLPTTINLQKNVGPKCASSFIHADASQIQEILVNLCNNAVHAMNEKGEIIISLEPVELSQAEIPSQYEGIPGRYAKLSVQDSGCGMPTEMLDKIFDPFYTTKEDYEGAGMGLATVQGIVAHHGGVIMVDSILGQGTVFNLYFPLAEETVTEANEANEANEAMPKGTEKILFIDDDEILATIGEKLLSEMGYQVTIMLESTEALKLFTANPDYFDLVITDQTMPNLCGKDLIQELKKIRPDLRTILCTGFSSQIDEDQAKKQGIDAFCMKPLDLPELLQTVRRVMDGEKE